MPGLSSYMNNRLRTNGIRVLNSKIFYILHPMSSCDVHKHEATAFRRLVN
jgi:hypothetical protein